MKIENDYPKIKNNVNKFLQFRKIMLIIFIISIILCTIINLSIGGKRWTLYVIGGEILFYFIFLDKPLIDNTLVKRITKLILIICVYLYLIDIVEDTNWSYFVINIISFCLIIIQLILFFIEYKHRRKKFIPMFWTSLGSIIFCLLAITKVVKINWAIIVLGSVGLVALIVLLLIYNKSIIKELKKYFNIK